ncbi:hypothetical protein [Methanococcus aeolicus]|uniref:hypothetical protein n=1 Tax=Methanococcus aeolicus TaxID=42879 RepID=UPI0021C7A16D|nr:hypothetical protein [Methanococcus aeolicus]UXM85072.1 hypothetical protein N6C89_01980 [Methanococcus aeolicus]
MYKSAEGLYIASTTPIKMTVEGESSYSTNPTKNIVFIKFYPSNTFGVANMMRLGVVQMGRNQNQSILTI